MSRSVEVLEEAEDVGFGCSDGLGDGADARVVFEYPAVIGWGVLWVDCWTGSDVFVETEICGRHCGTALVVLLRVFGHGERRTRAESLSLIVCN